MEDLYVFGTGDAQATHCYNTCFVLRDGGEYSMVDVGGGNGILHILEDTDVDICHIHNIFMTHEHTDHILGIVWTMGMIATAMKKSAYEGKLQIYCHQDLVETISTIYRLTMQGKLYKMIGSRTFLIPVEDGETARIPDHDVAFFSILSTKTKQFGFTTILKNGLKFTCAEDEPYSPDCRAYVEGGDWLPREVFCLYRDREILVPYEKHHNTVKEACKLTGELNIPNLMLWHMEDKQLARRKTLYAEKNRGYYYGNLLVPEDRGVISL